MHVTCAAIAKLIMETDVQVKENKAIKKVPKEDAFERVYNRKIHCISHSKLARDQILAAVNKVSEALVRNVFVATVIQAEIFSGRKKWKFAN